MVRKYFVRECGLMLLVFTLILLTNVVAYGGTIAESVGGVLILCGIAVAGLTISKFMSRFIHLPSMMYVSLLALLLACPISPVKDAVIDLTSKVAFMAPATALGAFAGISIGKDLKTFAKMGWKYVIITIIIITSAFVFSALIAQGVLKLTNAI